MVAVNPIKPRGLAKVLEKSANVRMTFANVRRAGGTDCTGLKCRAKVIGEMT
jgi:hypothetical protein